MAIVMMGRKFQQPPSPFYGDAERCWGREAVELETIVIRC